MLDENLCKSKLIPASFNIFTIVFKQGQRIAPNYIRQMLALFKRGLTELKNCLSPR